MTPSDTGHRRFADEVALALVTVAVVVGFSRLFDRATFYPPLLATAALAHVAAALTRRSRRPLAGPIMLVSGFVVTIAVTSWSTTTWGIPTPSTIRAVGHELRISWHSLSSVVAPAAPTTGFLLAAAIALWVTAWAADRLAFRFEAPVEALAPATTLFLFATLLAGPRHRVTCTAVFGVAILVYVLVERTVRLGTRPTALRAGPEDAGWRTIGAGTAMATAALVIGIGVVTAVPGLSTDGVVAVRAHRPNDAPRSVVSPLVDIRSRLIDQRDDVMFRVTASQPAYWRLMSLDEFDGTIWSSNQRFRSAGVALPSGDDVTTDDDHTKKASATFNLLGLGGPWAPAPFRATGVTGTQDLLWDPAGATLIVRAAKGDVGNLRYRIQAAVPVVTRALATSVTGPIPSDIRRTDLTLPANFPVDLATLADEIVAGQDTPFDKALALQNYFRNNTTRPFRYSTEVAAGQDTNAIRAFLQRRSGYCEQFAGTYAALARAVGLPTRVAVGFTSGEPQGEGSYLVYGRNAHAWPEVYLGGLGWLPFEPTPGRGNPDAASYTGVVPQQAAPGSDPTVTVTAPTIAPTTTVARSGPTSTAVPSPTLAPTPPQPSRTPGSPDPSRPPGWLVPLVAVAAVAALLLGTGPYLRHRRRVQRRLADPSPAGRVRVAWAEVLEAWVPQRLVRHASDTDLDMGARLAERLAMTAPGSALPSSAHRLAELSTTANWHAAGIDDADAEEAVAMADQLERQAEEGRSWWSRLLTRLDPRPPRA